MVAACMEDRCERTFQRNAAAQKGVTAAGRQETNRLSIQRVVAALSCALYGGSYAARRKANPDACHR